MGKKAIISVNVIFLSTNACTLLTYMYFNELKCKCDFFSSQELEDMLEAYEQQEKDFMEREQVLLDKLQTAPSKEKLVCTHYHLHLLLCYSLLSKIFCPNIILFNPQTYANFKMRQVYEINVM